MSYNDKPTKEEVEEAKKKIMIALQSGPRTTFGSTRVMDRALQSLRRSGVIVFKDKQWKLV